MKVPVGIMEVNICQHPGCQKEGVPFYSTSGEQDPGGFFCCDHCQEHGFNYSCSLFLGTSEFFDFGNGLFANFWEELEAEFRAGEEDFDLRTPDERIEHEEIIKYYREVIPREVSHCDPFPEKIGLVLHYYAT